MNPKLWLKLTFWIPIVDLTKTTWIINLKQSHADAKNRILIRAVKNKNSGIVRETNLVSANEEMGKMKSERIQRMKIRRKKE